MPPVNILLSGLPYTPSTLCLAVGDERSSLPASLVADAVVAATGLPRASFFLRAHGALLRPDAPVTAPGQNTAFVALCLRRALPGGKGGFGAMLRGAAASKKTTNFDACRDLQGRRLRHVRDEQAIRQFLQQQGNGEGDVTEAEQQAPPSSNKRARDVREHNPHENETEQVDVDQVGDAMERIARRVEDAVADAVAAGSARRKRPRTTASASASASTPQVVRPCDWMVDYDDLSSSDSEASRTEVVADACAPIETPVAVPPPQSVPAVCQR